MDEPKVISTGKTCKNINIFCVGIAFLLLKHEGHQLGVRKATEKCLLQKVTKSSIPVEILCHTLDGRQSSSSVCLDIWPSVATYVRGNQTRKGQTFPLVHHLHLSEKLCFLIIPSKQNLELFIFVTSLVKPFQVRHQVCMVLMSPLQLLHIQYTI